MDLLGLGSDYLIKRRAVRTSSDNVHDYANICRETLEALQFYGNPVASQPVP